MITFRRNVKLRGVNVDEQFDGQNESRCTMLKIPPLQLAPHPLFTLYGHASHTFTGFYGKFTEFC